MVSIEPAIADYRLEFLDARDLTTLSDTNGKSASLNLAVKANQKIILRLTAGEGWPADLRQGFQLQLVNLDQFTSPDHTVLQYPAGSGPSQMATGDFDRDGTLDIAVTNTGANVVSVSLGNGDGTFSAPRQWSIGAFRSPNPVGDDAHLVTYRRDILAEDFDRDGVLDLVITNFDSADISVLLGLGDGSFHPQRRFDAAAFPIGLASGDVNADGNMDIVVIDSPEINVPNKLAVLLGRGDGTFQPQLIQEMPKILFLAVIALADLDNNGALDLVVGGGINDGLDIFRGLGNGSFEYVDRVQGSRQAASLAISDLNRDGNLDVVAPSLSDNNAVSILIGRGDLSFTAPHVIEDVGQGPLAIRVVDWGSEIPQSDGSTAIGPPDGLDDLMIANSGVIPGPFNAIGPPGIVILLGRDASADGELQFADPIQLASAEQPLDLETGDYDRDGKLDVAVVDRGGFFILYGQPPQMSANTTQATARDLDTIVHVVQPTLTIVPGHEDSWFRMRVAEEAVAAAGDQVIDFSSGFSHFTGPGLQMEVIDTAGHRRGIGERFRVIASQNETLWIHVFSLLDSDGNRGSGAYTLAINTLPQLVAVEAPELLPGIDDSVGGSASSLVLVFQGERLDPETAENPKHYLVQWLGPDGQPDTHDDRLIPIGSVRPSTPAAIYSPSGNRDIASGRTYQTAVRQTVTLLFPSVLPAGSYRIEIAPEVRTTPFNSDERQLLSNGEVIGHHLVEIRGNQIQNGIVRRVNQLVLPPGPIGNFDSFNRGTRFLTQLHTDLGSLLDRSLSSKGDNIQTNTDELLNQIVARLLPAVIDSQDDSISLLVVLLDPVSISLVDPSGKSFQYDLQRNTVANNLTTSFVQVGGNVELVVIAQPPGVFDLYIGDVPPLARGGWAYLGRDTTLIQSLTASIRGSGSGDGQRLFQVGLQVASRNVVPPATLPMVSAWLAFPKNSLVSGLYPETIRNGSPSFRTGIHGLMMSLLAKPIASISLTDDSPSSNKFQSLELTWDRVLAMLGTLRTRNRLNLDSKLSNLLESTMPLLFNQPLIENFFDAVIEVSSKNHSNPTPSEPAAAPSIAPVQETKNSVLRPRQNNATVNRPAPEAPLARNRYGIEPKSVQEPGTVAPVFENVGADANRESVPSKN